MAQIHHDIKDVQVIKKYGIVRQKKQNRNIKKVSCSENCCDITYIQYKFVYSMMETYSWTFLSKIYDSIDFTYRDYLLITNKKHNI
jgi:hypothetical protein